MGVEPVDLYVGDGFSDGRTVRCRADPADGGVDRTLGGAIDVVEAAGPLGKPVPDVLVQGFAANEEDLGSPPETLSKTGSEKHSELGRGAIEHVELVRFSEEEELGPVQARAL